MKVRCHARWIRTEGLGLDSTKVVGVVANVDFTLPYIFIVITRADLRTATIHRYFQNHLIIVWNELLYIFGIRKVWEV